jgi:hypothetical protein
VPNDIRPFRPITDIWTDASESGWGGRLQLHDPHDLQPEEQEKWLAGWWSRQEVNCMRELNAVILVVQRSLEKGWIQEGCDVMIHTDNTNVV